MEKIEKFETGSEQTNLAYIASLIKQLLAAEGLGDGDIGLPNEPNEVVEEVTETCGEKIQQEMPMEEEEDEIEKAIEETPSEVDMTGNDSAEDRIENVIDEETAESVAVLAKAFAKIAANKSITKSPVKKSSKLEKVIKSQNERIQQMERVVHDILNGLGVAKAIEERSNTEKIQKSQQTQIRSKEDLDMLMGYIVKSLGNGEKEKTDETGHSNVEKARKHIRNVMLGTVQK